MPTPAAGHCVFETRLGHVGISFGANGLKRLVLPGRDRDAVMRRLLGTNPPSGDAASAPEWVAGLVEAVKCYSEGAVSDFIDVPVDLSGVDEFREAIYLAARRLKFGETTTYGDLAVSAGHPGMARETGAALGANPMPLVIPCHRILAAGGRIGGFSAPGGRATKLRMLALEGVRLGPPLPAQGSLAL